MTLNISNYLGQVNTQDGKQAKEMNEQLVKSLEAFMKRPIYTELTAVNIDTTSDENLLQIVFDNLNAKQQPDYENEYDILTK